MLNAQGISRRYGTRDVVRDVSLVLTPGTVLGLLGPNGAGKSTTLRMLAGVLQPDHGRVTVDGYDLATRGRDGRARIGFLPDVPPLYRDMTVDEFLDYAARLRGVPRRERAAACARVTARCDLASVGRRLIGNLSAGFRQRVGLAQALIHRPPIVILDEPTVGLDPVQLRAVREVISGLRDDSAVILSSHVLSEVQAVCDRVVIMSHGAIVHASSLGAEQRFPREYRVVLGRAPTADQLAALQPSLQSSPESSVLHMKFDDDAAVDAFVGLAHRSDWQLRELTPLASSLERLFFSTVAGTSEELHNA